MLLLVCSIVGALAAPGAGALAPLEADLPAVGAGPSATTPGERPPAESRWRPGPLDGLGTNIVRSFSGPNLLLHLGGVAATAVFVPTGVDSHVERYFHEHPEYYPFALPAVTAAAVGPVVAFGGLFTVGMVRDDSRTLGAAYAVLQAEALALAYVSVLKAVTGRPPPRPEEGDIAGQSRTFRFGLLRGGIYYGWPSGHTAAATALWSSLAAYYDSDWLYAGSIVLAAYTAVSVAAFNQGTMHWLSDGVAGALMGYAIGRSVGAGFREERAQHQSPWAVVPYADGSVVGVIVMSR